MQDVGYVVGAERASRVSFTQSCGNGIWTIFADENKQLANLPAQRTIGIGEAS